MTRVALGGSARDSLFVRLHTLVQFDDVAADEPHQVAEIRDGRLVPDVVQHVLVVHCEDKGPASGSGVKVRHQGHLNGGNTHLCVL